ncbi:carbamoyltransferase HypF [Rhodococcoides kyotonense]|uniref:Carbamoyltransferase n=1 Tax=Rhodococcoides kyotonense TaxID=398843 RepID=A0A239JGV7_9NOCA|nr:carbamoyltransferase HypF [Rhodococcus kyotonensis]SNT04523.1 hydrogenase maturation protein HypF [Rhodococcus kyotonensis]
MSIRRAYTVTGVVQGVGFRPFAYATATELSLTGFVGNTSAGVVVEVEGSRESVAEFGRRLSAAPPPQSVVESVTTCTVAVRGSSGFRIDETVAGTGRTFASPDLAMCADCVDEFSDPADRRYRHPFISCTNCGPRFTIIESLPYDRSTTTMRPFRMCAACAAEYGDPSNRRFHAQTIACWNCGPTLCATNDATGEDAIAAAHRILTEGKILAVKGIGGYHLACDATDDAAVAELRARKQRGDKPFAVMARDVNEARRYARVGKREAAVLTGTQRPIVVLEALPSTLASSVAPGSRDVGILLPYSPVHHLLLEHGPLVMTSGNLAGEPIAHTAHDAHTRLADIADGWLDHDRDIVVPCDDSVVRVVDEVERPIRRSRGYAPMPLALPFPVEPVLAVGGDLKNTCAVADGRYAWLGQHVGDMDDLATLDAFTASEAHLEVLTGVRPTHLVSDAHPGYRSAAWARRHSEHRAVHHAWHHHAHVAAVMAEHGLAGDEKVLGFAFDGTGYGTDGSVWGGEVLVADYKGCERVGHLRNASLAGGDVSVQRPYRMALAHLHAAGVPWTEDLPCVAACPPPERRVLLHQLQTGLGCVPTSSMGRLFDAVASIAGVRQTVDYEAQAAIELEALSRHIPCDGYRFGSDLDPGPVIRAIVDDVYAGVAPAIIGARFHRAVANLVGAVASDLRAMFGDMPVVLTGGVFQNPTVLSLCTEALRDFTVLTPRLLPVNDGALAFGQVLVGSTS